LQDIVVVAGTSAVEMPALVRAEKFGAPALEQETDDPTVAVTVTDEVAPSLYSGRTRPATMIRDKVVAINRTLMNV